MLFFFRYIWSFILGLKLAGYESSLNGPLELWLVNGRKVLNSAHTNYSFDSLHRVFRKTFRELSIREEAPERVLILGFGAGSVASILQREYGLHSHITGIDADPLLFRIAGEHFDIQPSDKLQLITADAVAYMESQTQRFDLVVTDIFCDATVPDAVCSPGFINNCLQALNPRGLFVMNFITSQSGRQLKSVTSFLESRNGILQVLYPARGNAVIAYRS